MDEKFEKLRATKCERDYKKEHCWEKLGVVLDPTKLNVKIYLVWRCEQCKKCICEELEFLK